MIVRFNKRGKGGGAGPANYLMGRHRDRAGASILKGDLEQTKELIDSLNFARNYTSGCLSFAEKDIHTEQKEKLMDLFEKAIFAGLDKDQYDITWIQHTDKNRLELNFLIPNVELTSGKRYQPYYDKADRPVVDTFQKMVNSAFGYHDPNDPKNKATLTHSRDLPKDKQAVVTAINNGIKALTEQGLIKNRDDVISQLKQHGFEVIRKTNKSISIANPNGGQNIRLKGNLYERDFKFSGELREEIETASKSYRASNKERFSKSKQAFQELLRGKQIANRKRYARPSDNVTKTTYKAKNHGVSADLDNSVSIGHVHSNKIRESEHKRVLGNNRASRTNTGEMSANHERQRRTELLPTSEERQTEFKRVIQGQLNNDRIRKTIAAITRTATERLRATISNTQQTIERIKRELERTDRIKQQNERVMRERTTDKVPKKSMYQL